MNVSANCITSANIFIDNTKRTLRKVSTEDLEQVIQDWIDIKNNQNGYLTGLTPNWNARTLAEIKTDLYIHADKEATKYRNIVGNLDHENHLLQFQKDNIEINDDLAITLITDVQIMLVFKEWRKRIIKGD